MVSNPLVDSHSLKQGSSTMSQQTDDPLSPTKTVHDIEPSKISRAGITTEKSLDWEAQRPPPNPAPELTPDDPDGEKARKKAEEEHQQRVTERRAKFRARAAELIERVDMATDRKSYDAIRKAHER